MKSFAGKDYLEQRIKYAKYQRDKKRNRNCGEGSRMDGIKLSRLPPRSFSYFF